MQKINIVHRIRSDIKLVIKISTCAHDNIVKVAYLGMCVQFFSYISAAQIESYGIL